MHAVKRQNPSTFANPMSGANHPYEYALISTKITQQLCTHNQTLRTKRLHVTILTSPKNHQNAKPTHQSKQCYSQANLTPSKIHRLHQSVHLDTIQHSHHPPQSTLGANTPNLQANTIESRDTYNNTPKPNAKPTYITVETSKLKPTPRVNREPNLPPRHKTITIKSTNHLATQVPIATKQHTKPKNIQKLPHTRQDQNSTFTPKYHSGNTANTHLDVYNSATLKTLLHTTSAAHPPQSIKIPTHSPRAAHLANTNPKPCLTDVPKQTAIQQAQNPTQPTEPAHPSQHAPNQTSKWYTHANHSYGAPATLQNATQANPPVTTPHLNPHLNHPSSTPKRTVPHIKPKACHQKSPQSAYKPSTTTQNASTAKTRNKSAGTALPQIRKSHSDSLYKAKHPKSRKPQNPRKYPTCSMPLYYVNHKDAKYQNTNPCFHRNNTVLPNHLQRVHTEKTEQLTKQNPHTQATKHPNATQHTQSNCARIIHNPKATTHSKPHTTSQHTTQAEIPAHKTPSINLPNTIMYNEASKTQNSTLDTTIKHSHTAKPTAKRHDHPSTTNEKVSHKLSITKLSATTTNYPYTNLHQPSPGANQSPPSNQTHGKPQHPNARNHTQKCGLTLKTGISDSSNNTREKLQCFGGANQIYQHQSRKSRARANHQTNQAAKAKQPANDTLSPKVSFEGIQRKPKSTSSYRPTTNHRQTIRLIHPGNIHPESIYASIHKVSPHNKFTNLNPRYHIQINAGYKEFN
eukprot:gene2897-1879_t